jgi:hypothetical protein
MTNATLDWTTTTPAQTLSAVLEDDNGNPITGTTVTYAWSFSDAGSIIKTPGPVGLLNSGTLTVSPTGVAGTSTCSVTATTAQGASATSTVLINVTGPVPAFVAITDTTPSS